MSRATTLCSNREIEEQAHAGGRNADRLEQSWLLIQ